MKPNTESGGTMSFVTLDEMVADIAESPAWLNLKDEVDKAVQEKSRAALMAGAMPQEFCVEVVTGLGWHIDVELK